jgi:glutamate-1-semialdehyde 2,1-aminomutase
VSIFFFNSNQEEIPEIISSKEQWLIDRNGRKLFDTWLGSGTLIFGHEKASEVKIDMLPNGVEFDNQLKNLFTKLVDFEIGGIGFQTSGSSAVTRAIRLARSITNRNKIAVIGGFWHGSDGDLLFKMQKQKISSGIPVSYQDEIQWFPCLEDFFSIKNLDHFAGVLIEPYQGSNPSLSMMKHITNNSREKLREQGVLLICDEVITGFRERYGSCNSSRKVNPDIVIFGKTAALGFPIGIVLVDNVIVRKLNTIPFWGGTASASPTQIYYLKKSFIKLIKLDYSTIEKNLLSLHEILNDSVQNAGFVIKSGCLFSRILKTDKKNDSRAFVSDDKSYRLLQSKLKKLGFFIGNNALVFPSIYNPQNLE